MLAPVRLVRLTARRISETDLTERIPVSGMDDIADLARTFNAMLDRLERAFAVQRSFLDDAGHELRTPITIVRGHLELMGEAPQDRRETLTLVDDELERMNRIVDDLLVLAKAERPDFLHLSAVDLSGLVADVVANARVIAPRDWALTDAAGGWAVLDSQRVRQAMLQLAHNATQHTDAGDRIEIGSALVPDRAELHLWVRDTGPGVAPEDAERIFQRFTRGGTGRRRSDGAGLGLPIVKAVAEAHGGRVTPHSAPGQGATFRLELPYRAATPGTSQAPASERTETSR